ncbi:hypothetical protein ABTZ99_40380 [Actinosynnema sp. NPDC002837]
MSTTAAVRPPGTYPGALPVLGHALRMKRSPGSFLLELQQGEPITRILLGRAPMHVVNDPDLVRDVMRRPDAFARGGPIAERFRLMSGNGWGISLRAVPPTAAQGGPARVPPRADRRLRGGDERARRGESRLLARRPTGRGVRERMPLPTG